MIETKKYNKININSRAEARLQVAKLFMFGVVSKVQANRLLKLIDQKYEIQQALQKELDKILAQILKKNKN